MRIGSSSIRVVVFDKQPIEGEPDNIAGGEVLSGGFVGDFLIVHDATTGKFFFFAIKSVERLVPMSRLAVNTRRSTQARLALLISLSTHKLFSINAEDCYHHSKVRNCSNLDLVRDNPALGRG